jgi:hypothetical protein
MGRPRGAEAGHAPSAVCASRSGRLDMREFDHQGLARLSATGLSCPSQRVYRLCQATVMERATREQTIRSGGDWYASKAVVACRARQAVQTSPYSVQDIPLPVSPLRGGAMGIQLSPVDEGKTKGPAQASASKCGRYRIQ